MVGMLQDPEFNVSVQVGPVQLLDGGVFKNRTVLKRHKEFFSLDENPEPEGFDIRHLIGRNVTSRLT